MAYFPYTRFDFDSTVNYYSPLTFDYTDTDEVKVIISDVNGNSEKLTYGIDYTLESSRIKINSPDTLGTKYSMTATKLFAIRMLGETTTPEFNYGVYLDVKKVQSALKSMALQIAELQMISENTVKLSYEEWKSTYDNPLIVIPTKTGRADKVFTFDSEGNVCMQSASDFIPGLNAIVAAVVESKNAAAQSAQEALGAEEDVALMKASVETSKVELEAEISTAYTEIESKRTEALSVINSAESETLSAIALDKAEALLAVQSQQAISIEAVQTQETSSKASLEGYEEQCKAYAESAAESAEKADTGNFYTKSETNALLDLKANTTDVDSKIAIVESNLPFVIQDGQLYIKYQLAEAENTIE